MSSWINEVLDFLKVAVEVLKAISAIIETLGKTLGVLDSDEKVDDLGEKALQAEEAGITPEKYDNNYDAYYTQGLANFQINFEKLHSERERFAKGTEVASKLVTEKYPLNISDLMKYVEKNQNGGFFNEKIVASISEIIKSDAKIFNNILGVLNGTEKNQETVSKTIDKMIEVEKSANPDMSDNDALRKIVSNRL